MRGIPEAQRPMTMPRVFTNGRRRRCTGQQDFQMFSVIVIFAAFLTQSHIGTTEAFSTSARGFTTSGKTRTRLTVGDIGGRPMTELAMSAIVDSSWVDKSSTRRRKGGGSVSSFANRMRNLVSERRGKGKEDEAVVVVRRKADDGRPANLLSVNTLEEYRTVVGEESNQIVVVRWYASWCKACKAVAPLYRRLARQHPNVKFVEVAVTDKNTDLHQGLEIPSLPYGHVYHPTAGLVEEMKILRSHFPDFEKKLEWYVASSCDIPDGDCTNPLATEEIVRESQQTSS